MKRFGRLPIVMAGRRTEFVANDEQKDGKCCQKQAFSPNRRAQNADLSVWVA